VPDTPKYRDEKLPVTGEVGSEGGSFADPTYQEATNTGDINTDAPPVAPDHLISAGPDPDQGMKKPTTE
jgi:hypothetical protein